MNTELENVILIKLNELLSKWVVPAKATGARKFTQAEFERLPALVSRKTFLEWTGYQNNQLSEEVQSGNIKSYRPKNRLKARYYKYEIARLGGWKM